MKLLPNLFGAALLGLALATAPAAQAQVSISLAPPSWGPAVPSGAQYYYIPETRGFYDVPARQYVVQRNGQWYRTSELAGYNPSTFHPVVVDYVGAQPWTRYDEYRNRYPRGGNRGNGAMPPGQAKKYGYRSNPSNGGLPPGQAKKQYRDRDDDRNRDRKHDRDHDRDRERRGEIIGIPLPDGRYANERRDDDRRRYEHDDDRGKDKNKGKGKKDKE